MKDLGRVTQFAMQAGISGERLFALLDQRHPVEDPPGGRPAPPLRQGLRFEDVHFSYGERRALEGLDAGAAGGQGNGAGGPERRRQEHGDVAAAALREAPGGTAALDGVDVRTATRPASVRAQFALVTQEPLLFSGNVLDNLRFARPEATHEEVEAAARVAHADGFIRDLPQGYETRIGERGVTLSGGQRQRLCIARAVLSRAPVLVLDEATSSLDPESEREVQAALAAVLPGRTALVVAHRLPTVTAADVIHVMEAGRVVERERTPRSWPRWDVLRLWTLQHGGRRWRHEAHPHPAAGRAPPEAQAVGLGVLPLLAAGFFTFAALTGDYPVVSGAQPRVRSGRAPSTCTLTRSDGRHGRAGRRGGAARWASTSW